MRKISNRNLIVKKKNSGVRMKKHFNIIFVTAFAVILLNGCSLIRDTSTDDSSYSDDTQSSEDMHTGEANGSDLSLNLNIESDKEYDYEDAEIRIMYPTVSADGLYDIKKIDLPETVNGLKCDIGVSVRLDMPSAGELIVGLEGETLRTGEAPGQVRYSEYEFGIYDIESGEYRTLAECDTEKFRNFYIMAYDDDHIVMNCVDKRAGAHFELYIYDIAAKTFKPVFEYTTNEDGYSIGNDDSNVILKNGRIYFVDCGRDPDGGDQLRASLYEYDIESGEIVNSILDAHRPMEYGDDVLYFSCRADNDDVIRSVSGKTEFKVYKGPDNDWEISDVGVYKDRFFGLYSKARETYHDVVWDWSSDKPVFEFPYMNPVEDFVVSRNGMAAFCYTYPDIPVLYDIENGRVVEFDRFGKQRSLFWFCKNSDSAVMAFKKVSSEQNEYYLVSPKK